MLTRLVCVVGLAVCALALSGCGRGDDTSEPAETSGLPGDLTQPGTELSLGDAARVTFEPDAKHSTELRVAVTGARPGSIKDLADFQLNDKAQKSNVLYVRGTVSNVGRADVGGEWLKLYGRASDTLVVQPVLFGSTFGKCDYRPLPRRFGHDERTDFCMVMLTEKPMTVSDVEWRFSGDQPPITWTVGAQG